MSFQRNICKYYITSSGITYDNDNDDDTKKYTSKIFNKLVLNFYDLSIDIRENTVLALI